MNSANIRDCVKIGRIARSIKDVTFSIIIGRKMH
jgi:hypothetical protein